MTNSSAIAERPRCRMS